MLDFKQGHLFEYPFLETIEKYCSPLASVFLSFTALYQGIKDIFINTSVILVKRSWSWYSEIAGNLQLNPKSIIYIFFVSIIISCICQKRRILGKVGLSFLQKPWYRFSSKEDVRPDEYLIYMSSLSLFPSLSLQKGPSGNLLVQIMNRDNLFFFL